MSIVFGTDLGGVVIQPASDNVKSDTSFFNDNYLNTPPVEGAFEALRQIVECLRYQNVYVISKCGVEIQKKSINWMVHNDFFNATGIAPYRVNYCIERIDKVPIAARLGLTHFVDDRLDILESMNGVVPNLIKFSPPGCRHPDNVDKHIEGESRFTTAVNWYEVVQQVLGA